MRQLFEVCVVTSLLSVHNAIFRILIRVFDKLSSGLGSMDESSEMLMHASYMNCGLGGAQGGVVLHIGECDGASLLAYALT